MRYNPPEPVELRVDRHWIGARLDRFVTDVLNWRSRTSIQEGIADGQITLNGRPAKPSTRVQHGDVVGIAPRPDLLPPFDPDTVVYDTLYEDDHLLAINKPPHLVVHPTASHLSDNLVQVLRLRYKGMRGPDGPVEPRLAHRIDANTSGVLLLTKQESVRAALARQFARRKVEKEYHALVHGRPREERFEIVGPIGLADPARRSVKRAVRPDGLPSKTHVRLLEALGGCALVSCTPVTGRTHQIRVHLAHAGLPILCDHLYGREETLTRGALALDERAEAILLDRHALHSRRLAVTHPVDGRSMEFTAPYGPDMERTLAALREADPREGAGGKGT